MLLRWLSAKRDYPWNNEPEPVHEFLTRHEEASIREAVMREWNRSANESACAPGTGGLQT